MVEDKLESFVVDSSVILSSILPDETVPKAIKIIIDNFLNNKINLIAPVILIFEVGNALKSAIKQKRIEHTKGTEIYDSFLRLHIQYITPNYQNSLLLSIKHNLSFYDDSYLCLVEEKNAKLLTLDKKLLACLSK